MNSCLCSLSVPLIGRGSLPVAVSGHCTRQTAAVLGAFWMEARAHSRIEGTTEGLDGAEVTCRNHPQPLCPEGSEETQWQLKLAERKWSMERKPRGRKQQHPFSLGTTKKLNPMWCIMLPVSCSCRTAESCCTMW